MKQITRAPRNHQLTNIHTWTPDSQWLVFDVRPSGASFTGETIERVNIHTGAVEVIYQAKEGAHVGVVTVHPHEEKYVFIHGPENPDADWHYDFHHRRGVIHANGKTANLDAMDITAPLRRARCAAVAMCMSLAPTVRTSVLPITIMLCMSWTRRRICVTSVSPYLLARYTPTHTSTRVCGKPLVRVGKPYHPSACSRQR
jgi:hypothetical protein